MNRRQQERFADLGRTFQSALEEIIDMGEGEVKEEVCQEEICQEGTYEEEIRPVPVYMNANLAQYDVTIKHVHNGFIVSVGCQTFVFETLYELAKYMTIYYDDPRGTYEKHYKGELFK